MTSFAPPHGGPRFTDRTVVITGAGYGIGRAVAERVASEGAHVVLTDLTLADAEQPLATLPGPGEHRALALDVTDTAGVDAAIAEAAEPRGLDVLVNVAGGGIPQAPFEQADDAAWLETLELNLLGVVRCCRAALPHLRRSTRSPAIVTVSSVNGLMALGGEAYSSAKAGLSALTSNLARQYGPLGVRVNGVAPGTVRTRVWDDQPGAANHLLHHYALGRIGEPTDIAAAIAFLASDDAAWITGHMLPVDGGLMTAPIPLRPRTH